MSGKVHAAFGAFLGYSVAAYMGKDALETSVMVGTGVIGALAADIDSMNSKISRKLPALSFLVSSVFGHRKLLHTPIFIIMVWLILHLLNGGLYTTVFCLGYAGHILQDTLTKEGIPLLYPFSKKKIALLPFRSGSGFDYLTTFCLVTLIIFFRTGINLVKVIF